MSINNSFKHIILNYYYLCQSHALQQVFIHVYPLHCLTLNSQKSGNGQHNTMERKNKLINSLAVYAASTETFHSSNYKNAIQQEHILELFPLRVPHWFRRAKEVLEKLRLLFLSTMLRGAKNKYTLILPLGKINSSRYIPLFP